MKKKLTGLGENESNETNEITDIERRLFRQIERLMNEDEIYRDPDLGRKLLTKKVNSNSTYVGNAIRKSTGKQLCQYIMEYRLNAAVKAIRRDPHITPQEIIKECGFPSKSTFYRKFVAQFKLTPGKFRSEVIKNPISSISL